MKGLVSVNTNSEGVFVPKGRHTSVEPGISPSEPVEIDVSEYLERQETVFRTNTSNISVQSVYEGNNWDKVQDRLSKIEL